jgi:transcriptional regulator with XRE-family HTH domain
MPDREVVDGLADKLKTVREAANLSQQQAADKSGVHQVSIARFETNKRVPTLAILYKLATAYGVNVCDLLPGGQTTLPQENSKSEAKKLTGKKGKK